LELPIGKLGNCKSFKKKFHLSGWN